MKSFLLLLSLIVAACSSPSSNPEVTPSASCDVVAKILKREKTGKNPWKDELALPATGKLYVESHLATKEDTFSDGRLFPSTQTELITEHLKRSCDRLAKYRSTGSDCSSIYVTQDDSNEFTPPEGGKPGQGSVGNTKPSIEQEMWIGNMMFAPGTKPAPGEKWLVSANGKYVAVTMGFEVGPGDQKLLGGVQKEVHWYLGTSNQSLLVVHGPLKDQSLPYGPIQCAGMNK